MHGLRGLAGGEVKCISDRITATAVSCQEIPSSSESGHWSPLDNWGNEWWRLATTVAALS